MQVYFTGAITKRCCSAQSLKPNVSSAHLFTRCFSPIGSHISYPWLSFCAFTVYRSHHSAATKLALAPVSIRTFSVFPFNSTLITGIFSFLSSSTTLIRCSLFRVVVHVSFLALKLNLSPEEANIGAEVMTMDLKMVSPPKTEAAGCYIELALGMAISVVAAWFVACIWQPYDPSFQKYSNSLGTCVHLHCLGP